MDHETLIRDADVFEFNYTPDTIHYRDQELRQLAAALSPALHGSSPFNANLRGPPGTGKTTCVRRIFSELEETASNVVTVFIDCEKVDTPFRVFAAIFERLFGQQPCLSGIPMQRLTGPIAEELTRRKAVLIVCLDDAHYLTRNGHLDHIVRSITRMFQTYPDVKTGIVTTISNQTLCPATVLEPSTYSVWQPMEIPFSHYRHGEVQTILSDRIRMGLYPGVIPPAILDHIVSLTMRGGDLRVGIDLLKHAVHNAEQDARTQVVDEDVTMAFDIVRGAHVALLIDGLKPIQKLLLSHIIEVKQGNMGDTGDKGDKGDKGDTVASLTLNTLYQSFKKTHEMSHSSYYNHLVRLSDLRLITMHRWSGKGNAHEIELMFDPGLLHGVCRIE